MLKGTIFPYGSAVSREECDRAAMFAAINDKALCRMLRDEDATQCKGMCDRFVRTDYPQNFGYLQMDPEPCVVQPPHSNISFMDNSGFSGAEASRDFAFDVPTRYVCLRSYVAKPGLMKRAGACLVERKTR